MTVIHQNKIRFIHLTHNIVQRFPGPLSPYYYYGFETGFEKTVLWNVYLIAD